MKNGPPNYRSSPDMSQLTRQMQITTELVNRLCTEIDTFIILTGKIRAETAMLNTELSHYFSRKDVSVLYTNKHQPTS